jgi:predicted transcriptional regulator
MAGRKTLVITDRQYRVLQLLWEHGPLTVRELMERLPQGERQPYTTALGMVQHMEHLGLVTHDKEALTHRYRPVPSVQV